MSDADWSDIIKPGGHLLDFKIKQVWRYRDLLIMLVKRNFISVYKQTILGPLWFFIQPLVTTITFTIIFGHLAKLSTDGLPRILFYMSGITCWNYFADCITKTATTFRDNQRIFGKVYFPRMVVPLASVTSNLIKFGIQLLLLFGFYFYYLAFTNSPITPNMTLLLLPVLILMMAGMGLGLGMVITSLTTKYRDLIFVMQFGIQLMMYATPIIYPLSSIPEKYRWLAMINPMSAVIEFFRYGLMGQATISWMHLGLTMLVTLLLLILGTAIFNHTEQNFIDTV